MQTLQKSLVLTISLMAVGCRSAKSVSCGQCDTTFSQPPARMTSEPATLNEPMPALGPLNDYDVKKVISPNTSGDGEVVVPEGTDRPAVESIKS